MSENRKFVEIGGATLHCVVEGKGLPLLVVGSSIYYPRTFSKSIRETCSLICIDLPHFVPLSHDFELECISFDFYAECIEAVRVDAGLGQVVIVGHSHHGNVALEYARRYPGSVSHVVLIGSPPVEIATTVESAEQYWEAHASPGRKTALQRRRRCSGEQKEAPRSPPELYVWQYAMDAPLYWNDPDYDASWLWEGMSFSMDSVHAFRNLYRTYELNWDTKLRSLPVLVVMGINDFAVPHTLWSKFLPALDNVTFRLLEHSGHTPQLEQPEEFDHLLLSWLKSGEA